MTCNCGSNSGNNIPCCCSQGNPVVCTTTVCPDAQVCDQAIESNCVTYTGPDIDCVGVQSGMNVTQVMDIILDGLNLINCSYCWSIQNPYELPIIVIYGDINGNQHATILVPGFSTRVVCGIGVDNMSGSVIIEKLGRCSYCFGEITPICITYTDPADAVKTISVTIQPNSTVYNHHNTYTFSVNAPNDTIIRHTATYWEVINYIDGVPTSVDTLDDVDSSMTSAPISKINWQDGFIRSTSIGPCKPIYRCSFLSVFGQDGGYAMERQFNSLTNDPETSIPLTFTLEEFIVNGTNYGYGQTLTLNLLSDLQIGVGQDGNHYVMNISDWLTSIAPHGFTCYDNMRVIDMIQGSTYSIRVRRDSNTTEHYFYTNTYGFAIGEITNTYGEYGCNQHYPITTTTSNKTRCTAQEYWSIERYKTGLTNPTYTFTLHTLLLNNIEYSTGQTLVVDTDPTTGNLIVGMGVDGITPYVMNINDWLTEIATGTGFIFHDDMRVIDKPTADATYHIEISNSIGNYYTYSSLSGFIIDDGSSQPYTCQQI